MNELIQVIKILDKEDVDKLNHHIDGLDLSLSTVFGPRGESSQTNEVIRSSTGSTLDENHQLTKTLHENINKGLDEYKRRLVNIHPNFSFYPVPGGFGTKSWREPIQVLQYEKSQEYKFHHDAGDDPDLIEYHRKISVIVYLTDDFVGGGTSFLHNTFKPKSGYGLIFPSNWCFVHAGEPVSDGVKRVAVTWYYVDLN
tara:strand:+ start:322 stop:915 length:594 start_codon:yes stop_codon:yes gene_type:complete